MSQFPLYTTLATNLSNKDLTIAQKTRFLSSIKDMEPEAHELIYILIKCYYLNNEDGDPEKIPYNLNPSKDRIDCDLSVFPNRLKQLLFKFATVHTKKLAEDAKLKELLETREVSKEEKEESEEEEEETEEDSS